jgi:hypothetical protein
MFTSRLATTRIPKIQTRSFFTSRILFTREHQLQATNTTAHVTQNQSLEISRVVSSNDSKQAAPVQSPMIGTTTEDPKLKKIFNKHDTIIEFSG